MFRLGSALSVPHVSPWAAKPYALLSSQRQTSNQHLLEQRDPSWLVNQRNPYFTRLRDRAQREGDAMVNAFRASQLAYKSGQGASAKELADKGNIHKAEMERLNRQASQWIFRGRYILLLLPASFSETLS